MSWSCPHQLRDDFCGLREEECQPNSEGCVLLKRFKFAGKDMCVELDENAEEQDAQK